MDIAYCGFDCTNCPLYSLSEGKLNGTEKDKIIADLLQEYDNLKEESLYCNGCKSGKRLFVYCNECYIRKCCTSKNIENCSHCAEFPCNELKKLFTEYPKGLEILKKMSKERK